MSDNAPALNMAAAPMLKRVAKKTTLLSLVAATGFFLAGIVQAYPRPWFPPAGVLFGAALGLLNFRWLALAVERIYLRKGATPAASNLAAAVINLLKLGLIFIILFIVIKWQIIHVFGLVAGLSLCFLAILWEGMTVVKQTLDRSV